MATSAARARGLVKRFPERRRGDVVALDGVDLDVVAGEIHGLVGPNGAGKTTLLGLLLQLAEPDAGTLELLGRPVRRAAGLTAGVAGFVDGPGLYPALTARRNLAEGLRLREGRSPDAAGRVAAALEEVGLADVADDRVRGFSLGMRQRLGLAAALLARPRLLVLDEPANGLDPAGTRLVHHVLSRLADAGTAVLLSSHRMDDLTALCDTVTLLAAGRTVFSGPLRKLATEVGELDHRLRTSDADAARRTLARVHGARELADDGGPAVRPAPRGEDDVVLVRGSTDALDALVAALVADGVAVRELTPVVSALEAAYLHLTEPPEPTTGEDA